ncbi:aromatic acid exporter family protein [Streptomyces sp. NPDC001820]|uniref:FUSC family protein n=1 Tax=Streptomyces sp. NPDC001820 TaxID=3364613 RepID=UPI0036A65115
MAQSLKAAAAAIAAWALTGWWLQAPLALMAPWTAIALVESTVYRSLRAGFQQLAIIVVGTLWASAAMTVTANSTLFSMLVTLPFMLLIGNYRRLGSQGIYGATTALLIITYGSSTLPDVGHRLLETLIGAAVGIAVNAFILPPVHLRSVRDNLERLARDSGALLADIAEGLREEEALTTAAEWHDRASRLTQKVRALADARQWARESYRFNPGRHLRRAGPPPPSTDEDAVWERISSRLMAVTHTLAAAADSKTQLTTPSPAYLRRYAAVLEQVAIACIANAELFKGLDQPGPVRDRREKALKSVWGNLDSLTRDFEQERGTAAAVGGELLVEAQQLLCELAPETAAARTA